MPKELTTNGDTSRIERVFLPDSSSTTGAGLTGLTFSSAGLIISTIADNEATATAYSQAGSTIETIATLGTYAAPTATKCRFKEVDATNHPGLYEIQFADARYAVSNAKKLIITISGAVNLAPTFAELQLAAFDVYDGVRGALTALPNAAADAAGGLPISDAGGLDLDQIGSETAAILVDTGTTLDGKIDTVDTVVDAIKAKTDTIGSGTVTVTSPVALDQNVTLVKGDDYKASDGRALDFTNAAGTWPDLTGATINFKAANQLQPTNSFTEETGSVVVASGANQQVRIEIDGSDTAGLPAGSYEYDVEATLSSGNTVTLVSSEGNQDVELTLLESHAP